MNKKIFALLTGCCLAISLPAQTDAPGSYHNFPVVVSIQFHSLAMPFRDIKSNLSNVGIGLGTEVSYNGKANWTQQISAVWYRNKTVGNGLLLYTQAAWRPAIGPKGYTELKAGAGYLFSFRPVTSYSQEKGEWMPAGHKGKGMLVLPAGLSAGFDHFTSRARFSPFISYQFLVLQGYNKSIPVVPETLLQVGTRIHPN